MRRPGRGRRWWPGMATRVPRRSSARRSGVRARRVARAGGRPRPRAARCARACRRARARPAGGGRPAGHARRTRARARLPPWRPLGDLLLVGGRRDRVARQLVRAVTVGIGLCAHLAHELDRLREDVLRVPRRGSASLCAPVVSAFAPRPGPSPARPRRRRGFSVRFARARSQTASAARTVHVAVIRATSAWGEDGIHQVSVSVRWCAAASAASARSARSRISATSRVSCSMRSR